MSIQDFLQTHFWECFLLITVVLTFIINAYYKGQAKRRMESLQREFQLKSTALDNQTLQLSQRELSITAREKHINDAVRQQIIKTVSNIASREYLASTPAFSAIQNDPDQSRMLSALRQNMKLCSPFNISSRIVGSTGETYEVTLYSCTCKDYVIRKNPCKHMYRLALETGALLAYDVSPLSQQVSSLMMQRTQLISELGELDASRAKLEKFREQVLKEHEDIQRITQEKSQAYPWLAKLYTDYFDITYERIERHLRHKHPPARKAAEEVAELRHELSALRKQYQMDKYQLNYYESIFPWLEEFKELDPTDAFLSQVVVSSDQSTRDEYEALRQWLSPEEYRSLSKTEKYQRALDRFQSRQKTKWEVGIEYERYIGYLCEEKGYRVNYTGTRLGLEDMGRDLVVTGEKQQFVIQCKRWAQEKQIHEKHIFQLYGSCVLMELQSPGTTVQGVFVTTATLSDTARSCAVHLGIKILEGISFQSYPVVKCNIGHGGEKIYHLPFDQQYDRVVVDIKRGESFASTILEAEERGFRRALHYSPSLSSK